MEAKLESVASSGSPSSSPAWDAASVDWALLPLPTGTHLDLLQASVRCQDAATESWLLFASTQTRCTASDFTDIDMTPTDSSPIARAVVRCPDLVACSSASVLGSIDIRDITAWI